MTYLDELGRELAAVGIQGRLRKPDPGRGRRGCARRSRRRRASRTKARENAVVEVVLVAAGFLTLGKRLGLRR